MFLYFQTGVLVINKLAETIWSFDKYKCYFKNKNGWRVQWIHQRVGNVHAFRVMCESSSYVQTMLLEVSCHDLSGGMTHVYSGVVVGLP
jgi:hypothetical protein